MKRTITICQYGENKEPVSIEVPSGLSSNQLEEYLACKMINSYYASIQAKREVPQSKMRYKQYPGMYESNALCGYYFSEWGFSKTVEDGLVLFSTLGADENTLVDLDPSARGTLKLIEIEQDMDNDIYYWMPVEDRPESEPKARTI